MLRKHNAVIRILSCLTAFACILHGAHAQMELTLRLEKADSTTIRISRVMTSDFFVPLKEITVSGNKTVIEVPLSADELEKNPVLHVMIRNSAEEDFNTFFAGLNEGLEIDARSGKQYYERKGRFYPFSQIIYSNDHPEVKQVRVMEELTALCKKYPGSEYLDFLIYNAYANGNLTSEAVQELAEARDQEAYWLKKVDEFDLMREKVLRTFFDTLGYHVMQNERVMVKFWGNWCKPCVEDNLTLKSMAGKGQPLPVIVGVQYDPKRDNDTFYTNILDNQGIISNHFQVQAFPTYVIVKGKDVVFRTHVLDEALGF